MQLYKKSCGEKAEELLRQTEEDCAVLAESGVPVHAAGEYVRVWKLACRQLAESLGAIFRVRPFA